VDDASGAVRPVDNRLTETRPPDPKLIMELLGGRHCADPGGL